MFAATDRSTFRLPHGLGTGDPLLIGRRLRAAAGGDFNALLESGDRDRLIGVGRSAFGFGDEIDDEKVLDSLAAFTDFEAAEREEGRVLADFAAEYGLPPALSYAEYVRLVLNLDRTRIRRTTLIAEAVQIALGKLTVPDDWYAHLADDGDADLLVRRAARAEVMAAALASIR